MKISRTHFVCACIAVALFFLSCGGKETETTAQDQPMMEAAKGTEEKPVKAAKLTVDQFEKMRTAGVELNVIDVRTPGEVSKGKIPDAMEINVESDEFDSKVDELMKEKAYILYCESGSRASDGAQRMLQKGFKNVYVLEGGYQAWEKAASK